jgi:hypothetical protein
VPGSSEAALLNEIGQMRVKQIKQELDELGVPHADAVEKSELVDRLVRARKAVGARDGAIAVGSRTAATPANPPAAPAAPPPPPSTSAASGAPYRFGLEDMADLPEGVLPENVSKESALEAMNQLMNDPKGFELLMELQSNPRVMQAAMEMSTGGEAAAQKYPKTRRFSATWRGCSSSWATRASEPPAGTLRSRTRQSPASTAVPGRTAGRRRGFVSAAEGRSSAS